MPITCLPVLLGPEAEGKEVKGRERVQGEKGKRKGEGKGIEVREEGKGTG